MYRVVPNADDGSVKAVARPATEALKLPVPANPYLTTVSEPSHQDTQVTAISVVLLVHERWICVGVHPSRRLSCCVAFCC